MQYFLHIARSQVHIARSKGVTFTRNNFDLRGEKFDSHLIVDSNLKMSKMMPLVSVFAV